MLALLERAADPVPTDVGVNLVMRETVRLSRTERGRGLLVRFDEATPDGTVHADPYLLGPLLLLLVATVHSFARQGVVVRARCTDGTAVLAVEEASPADDAHAMLAMRVLPAVPPTAVAARDVAARSARPSSPDANGCAAPRLSRRLSVGSTRDRRALPRGAHGGAVRTHQRLHEGFP